ncbi:hypothetical protein ABW21_db0205913 [Orbilia brochopaga]|nr:hypothetical protein ABW21_db0205913 [Drechslerella brochopaga]
MYTCRSCVFEDTAPFCGAAALVDVFLVLWLCKLLTTRLRARVGGWATKCTSTMQMRLVMWQYKLYTSLSTCLSESGSKDSSVLREYVAVRIRRPSHSMVYR